MRLRILLGSLVVCFLLLVGLWSTAYFHVVQAQNEVVIDLEKQGYQVTFEKVKTSGFPYRIQRTVDHLVLRSKDGTIPIYAQGGPLVMTVNLYNPSLLNVSLGETKCSFDRTFVWNFKKVDAKVMLDPMSKKGQDFFTITEVQCKKGDAVFMRYPELTFSRWTKNNSLHFETTCKNPVFSSDPAIEGFRVFGYFDTPHKSWQQLNKAWSDEYVRFKNAIDEAVATGQTNLPILNEWINVLEEQQISAHCTFEYTITPEDSLRCMVDLGVVDAMPHGMISLTGNGETYTQINKVVKGFTPQVEKDTPLDFSIKANGIFQGKTNIFSYQPVSWKTYPLVTEAIVCDMYKMYSHGEFRKARAENQQATEDPEQQYAIGEGYLLDSNYELALTWFKRAGLQHHAKALLHMAYHYFNGYGCEKNESLAREFTEDAVCQGVALNEELKDFADAGFIDWAKGIVGEKTSSDK